MSEPQDWMRTTCRVHWQGDRIPQTRWVHPPTNLLVTADARGVAVHGSGGLGTPALRSREAVVGLRDVLLLAAAEATDYADASPAGWRG